MLIFSHNELKKIAKFRGINGCKNMSNDKLLNILDEKKTGKKKKLEELFIHHQETAF